MKKRLYRVISLVLVLCMFASMGITAVSASSFWDVPPGSWYASSVDTAVRHGWMNGVGTSQFDPEGTLTRAMCVTLLHRYSGEVSSGTTADLKDVVSGSWYENAVVWAIGNGVMTGYGNGLFGVNDPVTREQIVTVFYRYAKDRGLDTSAEASLNGYSDSMQISDWAVTAMKWAVAEGILTGDQMQLMPQGHATRAQMAALMVRFADWTEHAGEKQTTVPVIAPVKPFEPEEPDYGEYIDNGSYATIFPCDGIPIGMKDASINTSDALYSDAAIETYGSILLAGTIPEVDRSNYAEDGVIHLYVYLEHASIAGSLTLELAGLKWVISNLEDGWNEIWLPLRDGEGTADLSAIHTISLTVENTGTDQPFLVDEIDIWHSEAVPYTNVGTVFYPCDSFVSAPWQDQADVITAEAALEKGIILPSAAALYHPAADTTHHGQAIVSVKFEEADISAYAEDGYLHFWLYLSEVPSPILRFGLTSSGIYDSKELRWDLKNFVALQPGWNEMILPLADATTVGGTIDLTAVNYIRIHTAGGTHGEEVVVLLDEVAVWHEAELYENRCTTDDQAVRIAAAALRNCGASVRVHSEADAGPAVIEALTEQVEEILEKTDHTYGVTYSISYDASSGEAEIVLQKNEAVKPVKITAAVTYFDTGVYLITPQYDASEQIVANIVIGEEESGYEADKTGQTDATQVIQNALNDVASMGGGTVWLPAGKYLIKDSIVIPEYVTLRGDYQDPDKVTNPAYGTILLADVASMTEGNNEPLIRLRGSSGAVGLTVYYPDQSMDAVKDYQYTFYSEGTGDGDGARMQSVIRNCTMLNAYRGIGFCDCIDGSGNYAGYSHEQAILMNIKGTFLSNMLTQRNSSDVGAAVGLTADSKYWANAGAGLTAADADAINAYTAANGIGLIAADVEGNTYTDVNIKGYDVGILLDYKSSQRTHLYAGFYHTVVSDSRIAMQIDDIRDLDGVNISASSLSGSEYSIYKTAADSAGNGAVHLTDVELNGAVIGENIVLADNDFAQLDDLWDDYYALPKKTASKLVVVTGADTTGTEDSTAAIQSALDSLSTDGGIVYLKAGHYRLDGTLTVPAGVELRGCTAGVPVRPQIGIDGGTVLEIYHGYDVSDETRAENSAILLSGDGAGVNGLIIAFRDQTTIGTSYRQTGYAVYANNAENVYVINSAILAASHGIELDGCDDHLLAGLSTGCYQNIFTVKNSAGGTIQRVLQNMTVNYRNGWNWSNWTTSSGDGGLSVTANNLDCMIFDRAEETVFAYFDYRGHNTFTAEDSQLTTISSGSGGDSTGYIYTATASDVTAVNTCSTRAERVPLRYSGNCDILLCSYTTRSYMPQRSFATPKDLATFYTLDDCDGEVLPMGNVTATEVAKSGTAWALAGSKLLVNKVMIETDLTDFEDGAIHLWAYAEETALIRFVLSSDGYYTSDYAEWYFAAEEGWNEIWLPLSAAEDQDKGLDLSRVNYMAVLSNETVSVVVDEICAAPKAMCPADLAYGRTMIFDCDTAATHCKIVTSSDTEIQLKSSAAQQRTVTNNGHLLSKVLTTPVNISEYAEDGWLHFWLYVDDVDKLNLSSNAPYLRVQLTSSGGDDAEGLRWNDVTAYNTLKDGWNEIWLPLHAAVATTKGTNKNAIDLTAVDYLRIWTAGGKPSDDLLAILDTIEIAHEAYSNYEHPAAFMILSCDNKDGLSEPTGCTVTNAEGAFVEGTGAFENSAWNPVIFRIKFTNGVDASYYANGYLHFSLYVADVTKLGATVNFELSSAGKNDQPGEMEYQIPSSSLKNGWNEIWVKMEPKAQTNMAALNWIRLFSVGGGNITVRLDNVYAALEMPAE